MSAPDDGPVFAYCLRHRLYVGGLRQRRRKVRRIASTDGTNPNWWRWETRAVTGSVSGLAISGRRVYVEVTFRAWMGLRQTSKAKNETGKHNGRRWRWPGQGGGITLAVSGTTSMPARVNYQGGDPSQQDFQVMGWHQWSAVGSGWPGAPMPVRGRSQLRPNPRATVSGNLSILRKRRSITVAQGGRNQRDVSWSGYRRPRPRWRSGGTFK